jgi:hypothetical protein
MLRITRDKAELGDAPFITFTVHRSPKDKTVCGYHEFDYEGAAAKEVRFNPTPYGVPVALAFERTRRFAESKGIPTIWIDDPNCLFEKANISVESLQVRE